MRQRISTRRIAPTLLILGLLLVGAAGAGGLWYLFFRPAAPPPVVDLGSAPAGATSTTTPGTSPGSTATAETGAPGSGSGATPGSGETWQVDSSIGSFSDFSGSFVGYRVQEELVNIGGNVAVGRTPEVTGSLTLDGTTVTSASFTAQLSGLKSDDSRRDGRVDDALAVRQFPSATFELTAPIQLAGAPVEGQEMRVTAPGKLTIRGVTREVQFPLTATLRGDVLTVKGALEFRFADFSVPKPTAFSVLSIADTGRIEVQLQMTRQG